MLKTVDGALNVNVPPTDVEEAVKLVVSTSNSGLDKSKRACAVDMVSLL